MEQIILSTNGIRQGLRQEEINSTIPIFLQAPSPGESLIHDTALNFSVSLGVWTGVVQTPPVVQFSYAPAKVNVGEVDTFTFYAVDNTGVIAKHTPSTPLVARKPSRNLMPE